MDTVTFASQWRPWSPLTFQLESLSPQFALLRVIEASGNARSGDRIGVAKKGLKS
jgi:hypothetical protein